MVKMNKFTRNCKQCGKVFSTNKSNKEYCHSKCRFKAWEKKHPRIKL